MRPERNKEELTLRRIICTFLSSVASVLFLAGADGKQQLLDPATYLEKHFRMREICFPAGFLCGQEELCAGLCDDFNLWCSIPVFLPCEKKGCQGTFLSAYRIMDCGIYDVCRIRLLDPEPPYFRIPVSHPLSWRDVARGSSGIVGFCRKELGHSVICAFSPGRAFEYAGILRRRK